MINTAPVAQLDRVSGYEPEGRAFESLRVHQQLSHQRAHRLAVRTLPFHGGNRGSIPRGRTNILFHAYEIILTKAHSFIWCAFVVFSLTISGQLAHIKHTIHLPARFQAITFLKHIDRLAQVSPHLNNFVVLAIGFLMTFV